MNILTIDMMHTTPQKDPLENPLLPKNTSNIFERAPDLSHQGLDYSQGNPYQMEIGRESIGKTVRAAINGQQNNFERHESINKDNSGIKYCITETEKGVLPGFSRDSPAGPQAAQ